MPSPEGQTVPTARHIDDTRGQGLTDAGGTLAWYAAGLGPVGPPRPDRRSGLALAPVGAAEPGAPPARLVAR